MDFFIAKSVAARHNMNLMAVMISLWSPSFFQVLQQGSCLFRIYLSYNVTIDTNVNSRGPILKASYGSNFYESVIILLASL